MVIFFIYFSFYNLLKITKSDKYVTNDRKCNLLNRRTIFANFALINSVKPYKKVRL